MPALTLPSPDAATGAITAPRPLTGRTVVFVHAHPDDEAIFTAVTMRALADAGARVVLVTATCGDLGTPLVPIPAGRTLAQHRVTELEAACGALGVDRLTVLGYRDSGLPGWSDNTHPRALLAAPAAALARQVARIVTVEGAEAVVGYDPFGVYGHPDHVLVHAAAALAADFAGVTRYDATVDRDRVRAHGTHLVLGAHAAIGTGDVGVGGDDVTVTVAGHGSQLAAKRAAMAAHASQIPAGHVDDAGFAASYRHEWYLRHGPDAVLDAVAAAAAVGRGA